MVDGLPARTGLGTWLLVRLADDGGSVVLAVRDDTYGLAVDQHLSDAGLPVRALIDGHGPWVARVAGDVQAYASASPGGVPVGALAGVPVLAPDGSVFGCLCGIDLEPGRPSWPPSCRPSSCWGGCWPSCSSRSWTARSCSGGSSWPSWTPSPTPSPGSGTAAPGTGCWRPRRPAAAATARWRPWS